MASLDVVTKIVERNLGVYRADPGRLREDVSQEAQIAEDYRGRLVYELLQNADDAMQGQASHDDRVAFLVTDDALWMSNTGRPLTDDDVVGLCGLGASSKTDSQGVRRASIGHKGLGFKSVLEITDRPAAYSSTYCFELGEPHARPHVDGLWREMGQAVPARVPAMRFPAPLADTPAPWHAYLGDGYHTGFHFPFRPAITAEKRQALGDQLLQLPLTTVLFLKHLERIDVRVEQQGRSLQEHWTVSRQRRENDAWNDCTGMTGTGLYRITVRSSRDALTFLVSHDADVPIGENRLGLSGPAWEGVDLTEVSVAVLDPMEHNEQLEAEARRFHVFLPTEQQCPYPMLVNGAFSTDLSRQRVKVTRDANDYNAHLVRTAARVFQGQLVPVLVQHSVAAVLGCLERSDFAGDDTTDLLHEALVTELASMQLLPGESGHLLSLQDTIVPPVSLGEQGRQYRETLAVDARWAERRFPAPLYCAGRLGRIAVDHGAQELTVDEAIQVLGTIADPSRSRLIDHDSGGFAVDPVLELCVALWQSAAPEIRSAVAEAARSHAVFPVHRLDGGAVQRVAIDESTAFYPSRAAKQELPLAGLQFLCHEVCWGALTPKERNDALGDRMLAWAGLFDIRDFDFEEVMRAAVIPALRLDPDEDVLELREGLESVDTLAAICQLAGKRPKHDRPLRYQRLGSDRALFNLARLRVPCRTVDGEERWEPAYRVYFGKDWLGADSVEHIMEAVPHAASKQGHIEHIAYLAPPAKFLGTLDLPRSDFDQVAGPAEDNDDEVDLDEDADTPLETDERERWTAFLTWLGVNPALRPVHFHDVEERGSGWVSTKGLPQPDGWAFSSLGTTWSNFRAQLEQMLDARPDAEAVDPYLYEAHDLEFIVPLLEAASQDASGQLGGRLLAHLTRHWRFYEEFAEAELALVGAGKWPTHRTKPSRALPEERFTAGDNLWLFRLRRSRFCPTTHGPREPAQTWLSTAEAHRRFGQRGRAAGDFLPLLELDEVDPQRLQNVARRLGIRVELSPATFTLADARLLTERLQVLYGNEDGTAAVSAQAMSRVVRPVYREMFELLSGRSEPVGDAPPLQDVPLLVEDDSHLRFVPAAAALYARAPGMKERSGVADLLPIFVLEAHPAANAPLARLFGVRALDDELNWQPSPREIALDPDELDTFRDRLRSLLPALLARIRAERSEPRDRRLLDEFVKRVEPVEELELTCSLGGTEQQLRRFTDRRYFVAPPRDDHPLQAFIVWDGPAWPPGPEQQHAMAMAMADLLGLNLVEAFLAFLGTDDAGRRRLLGSAGASAHLMDVLAGDVEAEPDEAETNETTRTVEQPATDQVSEVPATPLATNPEPAAPRIPLLDFATLLIDGEPLLITGAPAGGGFNDRDGQSQEGQRKSGHGAAGAAPGMDLQALDSLGMRIAATYELRRLQRAGHEGAVLGFGQPPDSAVGSLVVDVSTPAAILRAEDHPVAKQVLLQLEQDAVSRIHPGFDLLTIAAGEVDRLIELKSSGVDALVQAMSWNEWKSARNSRVRERFWLYLVGNLRADLPHAEPFVRAIHDPFGTLVGEEVRQEQVRRAVQLRVREFKTAEHLDLTVLEVSR